MLLKLSLLWPRKRPGSFKYCVLMASNPSQVVEWGCLGEIRHIFGFESTDRQRRPLERNATLQFDKNRIRPIACSFNDCFSDSIKCLEFGLKERKFTLKSLKNWHEKPLTGYMSLMKIFLGLHNSLGIWIR